MDGMEEFFFALGVVVLVMILFLFISYIFDSLLKMKIFKLFMPCSPVIAWVPFLSSYYLGRCCNGKDGQNIGIFGISVPNWMWNFGWCAGIAINLAVNVVSRITGLNLGFISGSGVLALSMLYYMCIYSFLYSRIEGRPEPEVRAESILSAVIGIVGLVKILTCGVDSVYSLPNDEFPEESRGSSGGYYGDFDCSPSMSR